MASILIIGRNYSRGRYLRRLLETDGHTVKVVLYYRMLVRVVAAKQEFDIIFCDYLEECADFSKLCNNVRQLFKPPMLFLASESADEHVAKKTNACRLDFIEIIYSQTHWDVLSALAYIRESYPPKS